MEMPLVCIIIVNFNGRELLANCLASIKKNTLYKNYKVIIVDNASKDNSIKMIKSKFKWVKLITNKKNEGFSRGNNIGIKYALKKYKPSLIYLLNNDTKVMVGWLESSINLFKQEKWGGMVGSKQLNFEGNPSIAYGDITPFKVRYYWGVKPKKVNWISGAGLLIKTEVFNNIGLFDEKFNPAYYEESDLEERARKAGYLLIANPNSIIFHKGGETSHKVFSCEFQFELFYKNRIYYFLKNKSILYFLPRMIKDFLFSVSHRKVRLLIKSYKEGIKKLK
jgi:hypothetical protein